MPILTEALFVHLFVSAVAVVSVGYVALSRKPFASITALLMLCFGMFAYTVFPMYGSDEPHYWYQTSPPPLVSRIVLGATLAICMIIGWRERHTTARIKQLPLFIAFLVAIIFSSVFSFMLSPHFGLENLVVQFKFSIILCFYIASSYVIGITVMPMRIQNKKLRHFCNLVAFLGIVSLSVAVLEVGLDIAYVQNFMRGAIETRASSLFHNPNWFALCLAITAFLAAYATFENQNKQSIVLFAVCTSAVILSGSRSTLSILIVSFTALVISLTMIGSTGYKALRDVIRDASAGIILGLTSLLVLFLFLGKTATSRYTSLLERVFLWPLYLSSDLSAQSSLTGRMLLPAGESKTPALESGAMPTMGGGEVPIYGQGVVDNAYLYWLQRNPIGALLLIIFVLFILAISLNFFLKNRTPANALRVSASFYIMLSGAVGQVYWAFPVWIPLSILTAFVLAVHRERKPMNRKFPV